MNRLRNDESLEEKLVLYDSFSLNEVHNSQTIEVSKTQFLHSIAYAMNNGHKRYGSQLLKSFGKLFDENSSYSSTCELQGTDKIFYETLLSYENSTSSRKSYCSN